MTDEQELKKLKIKIKELKAEVSEAIRNKKRIRPNHKSILKHAQVKYRKLYMKLFSKNYYKKNPEKVIEAVSKYKRTENGLRSTRKYLHSTKGKRTMKTYNASASGKARQKKYTKNRHT